MLQGLPTVLQVDPYGTKLSFGDGKELENNLTTNSNSRVNYRLPTR